MRLFEFYNKPDDQDEVPEIPKPRKYSDIELSQIDKRIIPVAVDDWLLFGQDPITNEVWFTVMEMWPEWLDYDIDPSDMSSDEYKKAALEIFTTRRQEKYRTLWLNQKDDFIEQEIRWAEGHNKQIDSQWLKNLESDWQYLKNSTESLINRQRK